MADAKSSSEPTKRRRPPATTPEARERQLISLAVDLAEDQLIKGTASSQTITHYLKLGTTREKLEQEKLAREVKLLEIKAESYASGARVEELYGKAISAMREYQGHEEEETYED